MRASAPVRAPSGFTLAYVRTYFEERAPGASESELSLRLPLYMIASGLSLDKPVAVEVRAVPNHGASDTLAFSWSPKGSGAFPRFEGAFSAAAEGDARCRLGLSGTYTAPGGIAGAAFDALLGARIARATVDGLLQQLATAVEMDYHARMVM